MENRDDYLSNRPKIKVILHTFIYTLFTPLFIVHSNVCVAPSFLQVLTARTIWYCVDQCTYDFVKCIIMYKSDVFHILKTGAKSEAKFDLKSVNLYCDNGGKYLSTDMKNYCS